MIPTFATCAAFATAALVFSNIYQNPATPASPITVSIDAGKGVLAAGAGAGSTVKLSFTNNTKERQKIDAAVVGGLGLFILPGGVTTKPTIDMSSIGKEPPFEIPAGGTLISTVDLSAQINAAAAKADSGSIMFEAAGMSSGQVPVELVEDLTKTLVVFKTNKGVLKFKVDPVHAPLASRNFVKHAEMGTYAGTQFHRVIKGFMAQGGDPNSKDTDPNNDGQGGAPYNKRPLVAEFNEMKHVRGVLSMARGGDPIVGAIQSFLVNAIRQQMNASDPNAAAQLQQQITQLQKEGVYKERAAFLNSAGSQFFLCFATRAHLDNNYTVFGQMVEGEETLKAIEAVAKPETDPNSHPTEEIKVEQVTIEKLK